MTGVQKWAPFSFPNMTSKKEAQFFELLFL